MSHYCMVCGRELIKTSGPIGPTCLKKIQPRNRRVRGLTKKQYNNICSKYDMYRGTDGQTEDDTPGESSEGQEASSNGKIEQTTSSSG